MASLDEEIQRAFAEDKATVDQQFTERIAPEIRAAQPKPIEQRLNNFMQQEIFPGAGLIGGGAVGAATGNPYLSALGAGLGYAGGDLLGRAGQSIADWIAPTPGATSRASFLNRTEAPGTQALGIAGNVVAGAAMDLTGTAAGNLPALGNQLKGAIGIGPLTPGDLAYKAATDRLGMEYTSGALRGSQAQSVAEHAPSRFPIGMQASEPKFKRIREQGEAAVQRMVAQAGPLTTKESAGTRIKMEVEKQAQLQQEAGTELVNREIDALGSARMGRLDLGAGTQEALKPVQAADRAAASAVYEAAMRGAEKTPIILSGTNKLAADAFAVERRLGALGQSKVTKVAETLKDLGGGGTINTKDLPPEAMLDLVRLGKIRLGDAGLGAGEKGTALDPQSLPEEFMRRYGLASNSSIPLEDWTLVLQRLRGAARATSDPDVRRRFKAMEAALLADGDATAQSIGGTFAQNLRGASSNYRSTVAQFWVSDTPLGGAMDMEAGALAKRILAGQDVDLLKPLMDKLPDSNKADVRRQFLEQIKAASSSVALDGNIDPLKWIARWDRIPQDTKDLVFGSMLPKLQALRNSLVKNYGPGTRSDPLEYILKADNAAILGWLTEGKNKSVVDATKVWTSVSPQAQGDVRAAMVNRVLADSFDQRTHLFSQSRFQTAKSKVRQEIWDLVFSGTPIQQTLKDLDTVFARNITYAAAAANPSGTAGQILGPTQLISMGRQGAGAVAAIGAQGLAGAGLLSDAKSGTYHPLSSTLELLTLFVPLIGGRMIHSNLGQRMMLPGQMRPLQLGASAGKTIPEMAVFNATRSGDEAAGQ